MLPPKLSDNVLLSWLLWLLTEELYESLKSSSLRRFIQEKLGYPLEKHFYTTKDGYINSVYRIPGVKGTKSG